MSKRPSRSVKGESGYTSWLLWGVSAVWPFETGWAAKAKWLPKNVLILHAEIYPSVRDSLPDDIKDRGQVRAMWQCARDLDRDNLLWREFCRPIEVETGSKEDLAIQLTEGWILSGVKRTLIPKCGHVR